MKGVRTWKRSRNARTQARPVARMSTRTKVATMMRVWNFSIPCRVSCRSSVRAPPLGQGFVHEGPEPALEGSAAVGFGLCSKRNFIKTHALQRVNDGPERRGLGRAEDETGLALDH